MPQPAGDAIVLLLQAFEAGVKVAPGKAYVRFEVPMIEAVEAVEAAGVGLPAASISPSPGSTGARAHSIPLQRRFA